MKIPYLEIIKKDDYLTFFLIEDISHSEEWKELFQNYHDFWNLTNSFISALEHYFKFESISSIKECLDLKKEIDNCYKRNILKEEDSIYLKLVNDLEYDYKSLIYESKDIPQSSIKMNFLDIIKISNLSKTISDKKESVNVNNLPTKPGRGQKLCKNKDCKQVIGARSLKCKYCGN